MSNAPLAIERPLSLENPLEMDDARIASRRAATVRHEAIRTYLRLQKELASLNHAYRLRRAQAWAESTLDEQCRGFSAEGRKLWVEAAAAPAELELELKRAYVNTQREYLKELSEERSQLKSLIEWSMRLDPSWEG